MSLLDFKEILKSKTHTSSQEAPTLETMSKVLQIKHSSNFELEELERVHRRDKSVLLKTREDL